jgi:biopolymer transport protein ExbD
MASIQAGGPGGKKSVDVDVPLVPFIDLLLCCIMFLLVTAVWNQLGDLTARQQIPGDTADALAPPPSGERLVLRLRAGAGWELSSSAGDRYDIPADEPGVLAERLEERRRMSRADIPIVVAPEDGVPYERIISAMDVVAGAGYADVSLSDGAGI